VAVIRCSDASANRSACASTAREQGTNNTNVVSSGRGPALVMTIEPLASSALNWAKGGTEDTAVPLVARESKLQ